jgi:hypothetical protein
MNTNNDRNHGRIDAGGQYYGYNAEGPGDGAGLSIQVYELVRVLGMSSMVTSRPPGAVESPVAWQAVDAPTRLPQGHW